MATAHDGRAAIAAIRRDPGQFVLIITDLHLPGADGFEVLRATREVSKGLLAAGPLQSVSVPAMNWEASANPIFA